MRRAEVRGQAIFRAGVVAVAAALTIAGGALASTATPGATYTGHYLGRPTDEISFKVSANGKKLIDLMVDTPFKCNGGCGGVGTPNAGSASISKGKFKAVLKIPAPGPGAQAEGTDTVTGTFAKHGQAKGTVASHFYSSSSGETVSWTATS
ncbi:MAG TPA: hypothetical protein VMB51_06895 [Solirubrobacteraceae bacterium]|nr:hypothetical protein [Solirubrobacteraceae bacterium]